MVHRVTFEAIVIKKASLCHKKRWIILQWRIFVRQSILASGSALEQHPFPKHRAQLIIRRGLTAKTIPASESKIRLEASSTASMIPSTDCSLCNVINTLKPIKLLIKKEFIFWVCDEFDSLN
jgi:hypothetical protein